MLVPVLFLLPLALAAQDPRQAMETAIAKQLASIELQQSAIRAQTGASAFSIGATVSAAPVSACDPMASDALDLLIDHTAAKEALSPDLLRAVIDKESGGRPCAVSEKGAQGLMQLMPATASLLGVEDPFDPAQNISGGARFLRYLLGRYDQSLPLALAAYNAGPGRVDSAGGIPAIAETEDYVGWILKRLLPAREKPSARSAPFAAVPSIDALPGVR